MKTTRYNTKQRDRLMAFLQAHKNQHLTVDEILSGLRGEQCQIGASTVYRYLDLLVQEGEVRKFIIEEGYPACYQYFGNSSLCLDHFHLKCSRCGELYHIESGTLAKAHREIYETYGFTINSSKTVFYGRCAQCGKGATI